MKAIDVSINSVITGIINAFSSGGYFLGFQNDTLKGVKLTPTPFQNDTLKGFKLTPKQYQLTIPSKQYQFNHNNQSEGISYALTVATIFMMIQKKLPLTAIE